MPEPVTEKTSAVEVEEGVGEAAEPAVAPFRLRSKANALGQVAGEEEEAAHPPHLHSNFLVGQMWEVAGAAEPCPHRRRPHHATSETVMEAALRALPSTPRVEVRHHPR